MATPRAENAKLYPTLKELLDATVCSDHIIVAASEDILAPSPGIDCCGGSGQRARGLVQWSVPNNPLFGICRECHREVPLEDKRIYEMRKLEAQRRGNLVR